MKPRIQIGLVIDTLAHAATIRQSIVEQLAGKDIFEQHQLRHFVDDEGTVRALVDVRFNSRAHRDAFRDWVRDQIQNNAQVKVWVLKARVEMHDCSHDEGEPGDCAYRVYELWRKV